MIRYYTISLQKEFINYSCTSYLSSRWWWRWGWWWWRVVGLCSCHSKKGWSTPCSCWLLLVWRICQMTSWWQRWINKMCSSLRRSTIRDTSSRSYNHNCLRRNVWWCCTILPWHNKLGITSTWWWWWRWWYRTNPGQTGFPCCVLSKRPD
jgi:hypothetical protein